MQAFLKSSKPHGTEKSGGGTPTEAVKAKKQRTNLAPWVEK